MMEPPGGTGAGRGVDHRGARLPPRDAQGRRGIRRRLVVQGVGTGAPRRGRHRQPRRLDAARERALARLRRSRARLQHARPDQGDGDHAGPRRRRAISPRRAFPASIVTKYLAEHGIIVEKTGLYSFFIMFTIGITKGRWNTLVTELQQFKDDYDDEQAAVARAARVRAGVPALREDRPARPVRRRSTASTRRTTSARLTTEMYLSQHGAGDEARPTRSRAWRTARSTASRSTTSKGASPACC